MEIAFGNAAVVEGILHHKTSYPYLGINEKNTIVLFITYGRGIILRCEEGSYVGVHKISEQSYRRYMGKILISNEVL